MRQERLPGLKKILCLLCLLLVLAVSAALLMICFGIDWMFDTWHNLTIEELVFHLKAPLEGTNEEMVGEFFERCAVPVLLIVIAMSVVAAAWKGKRRCFFLMAAGVAVPLICAGMSVYLASQKLGLGDYMESQGEYSTFIEDYYVDPSEVEITFPEQKRNLIFIYLESMETTYAGRKDGGAFYRDVMPELTALAKENEDFSGSGRALNGAGEMTGTTWTMASLFSHTSGLPLNISIDGNSMGTQSSFFSGITTLGDILNREGYSQTFMIGSDGAFGGRDMYFSQHGNYAIEDYGYALRCGWIPENYMVWWGYEDKKLFKNAREELLRLAAQDEPFNFTLLTADTHFEDGYRCEFCPDTYGDDQYANVIACSSRQVSRFVSWIQRQDFYDNTTVILVGDHLTMDSDFCDGVDEEYERKAYAAYINPAAETAVDSERRYTSFDHFPTTLAAMGVSIEGDRLGLGTNLFSSSQTLTERFGAVNVEAELSKKSAFMEAEANISWEGKELTEYADQL